GWVTGGVVTGGVVTGGRVVGGRVVGGVVVGGRVTGGGGVGGRGGAGGLVGGGPVHATPFAADPGGAASLALDVPCTPHSGGAPAAALAVVRQVGGRDRRAGLGNRGTPGGGDVLVAGVRPGHGPAVQGRVAAAHPDVGDEAALPLVESIGDLAPGRGAGVRC